MGYAIKAGVAAIVSLFAVDFVEAAEIDLVPSNKPSENYILIRGELEPRDEQRFIDIAVTIQEAQAIVVFDSIGGNVFAGIEIGKVIRAKDFATAVSSGTTCASACALGWLGGRRRLMSATARIGFHAVYTMENGAAKTTGAGNALVGAYLNQLGLPDRAVSYITESPPESVTWLDLNSADAKGIDVKPLITEQAAPQAAAPIQRRPISPKPSTDQTPAEKVITAPKMSPALTVQLDKFMIEKYKRCWEPVGDNMGQYSPKIKVTYNPDGSLAGEPSLVNPPSDPALVALAHSALLAVYICNPLSIPARFLPFYQEWKNRTISFNPY